MVGEDANKINKPISYYSYYNPTGKSSWVNVDMKSWADDTYTGKKLVISFGNPDVSSSRYYYRLIVEYTKNTEGDPYNYEE